MAANDYYNQNPSSRHQTPQPQPYAPYQGYDRPTPPGPAPSYHSQPPSRVGTAPLPQPHDITSPVSPFEAPFDDHVYPAPQPSRFDSQSTLGADTRYYGGGTPLTGQSSYQDNIPLRDHPGTLGKDNSTDHVYDGAGNSTDHVYDAATAPANLEEGRKKNRFSAAMGLDTLNKRKTRIPWVVYVLTLVQVVVFIVEIVKNAQLTGSPIEIHPSFNPMIGPSPYVLINMGARYVPCMHAIDGIQNRASGGAISWPCPNTTSTTDDCQLNNLCGFGMPASDNPVYPGTIMALNKYSPQPNQWFRFILPIFLHAGIIHIGFNMLLQMTLAREMEISIGPLRFFLVYMASGIFGFVLGGNFAATGIASTGASGALFGIIALNLLDLLYTWGERKSPWKDFAFIMLDVVISFVLGLLPGLDNFSHIGGFFMGLVLGICILHSPNSLRQRISQDSPPYTPVAQVKASDGHDPNAGITGFVKSPVGFFKGRKPAWWAWWLVRAGSLVFVLIVFILLLNNFYVYRKTCSWCKYLSCLNINNWCDVGNLQLTQQNTTTKRSVLESWDQVAKLYEVL